MNPIVKAALDAALDKLKSTFVKAVVAKAITALPQKLAVIVNPILGFFVGLVWNWAEEYLFEALKEFATILNNLVIKIEREAKNEAYKEAKEELEKTLAKYGVDHEKTKQISEDFDRKLRDLIVIRPRLR